MSLRLLIMECAVDYMLNKNVSPSCRLLFERHTHTSALQTIEKSGNPETQSVSVLPPAESE